MSRIGKIARDERRNQRLPGLLAAAKKKGRDLIKKPIRTSISIVAPGVQPKKNQRTGFLQDMLEKRKKRKLSRALGKSLRKRTHAERFQLGRDAKKKGIKVKK